MSQYRSVADCDRSYEGARCKTIGVLGAESSLEAFEAAVQSVLDYGIPVVASSNNNARDACNDTPARLSWSGGFRRENHGPDVLRRPGVITVGGWAKIADQRYVNRTSGNTDASNWGPCIDIWAPAENIATASTAGWNAYRDRADTISGTSYAAPMVAGLIARMLSEDSDLRGLWTNAAERYKLPEEIWTRLQRAATRFGKEQLFGADEAFRTFVEGTSSTAPRRLTAAALDASSLGLAYMGAFNFKMQPTAFVVSSGTATSIEAIPVGEAPDMTEWFRDDAREPCLTKRKTETSDHSLPIRIGSSVCGQDEAVPKNARYWARVTRGSYTADSAVTTVVVDHPVIDKQPENQWVEFNGSFTLSVGMVTPANSPAATYEWTDHTGMVVSTDQELTVTNATQSAGYQVKVTVGSKSVTSRTAFVRVEKACPAVIRSTYTIETATGYVQPTFTVTLAVKNPEYDYHWYAGSYPDASRPIIWSDLYDGNTHAKFTKFTRAGEAITVNGAEFPKVWARAYDPYGCLIAETETITPCSFDIAHSTQDAIQFVRPNALRVLSARCTTRENCPPGQMCVIPDCLVQFDWQERLAEGVNGAEGVWRHVIADDDFAPRITADITFRLVAHTAACKRYYGPIPIDAAPANLAGLCAVDSLTVSGHVVRSVFAGTPLKIPFTQVLVNGFQRSTVAEYEWLLGGNDLTPTTPRTACTSNPCVAELNVTGLPLTEPYHLLRLRSYQFGCPETATQDSDLIRVVVYPCDATSFKITAEPAFLQKSQTFTLVAPAMTGATYTWYSGSGHQIGQPTTDHKLTVNEGTTEEQQYSVEITGGCRTSAVRSEVLTVAPCYYPKRRSVRSLRTGGGPTTTSTSTVEGRVTSQGTETVAVTRPGQMVTLAVYEPETGEPVKWYIGTNYDDLSRYAGSGGTLTVTPTVTTTYWATAVVDCGGSQVSTYSDFFVIEVACDTTITRQPEPAFAVFTTRPATVAVSTSVEGRTATPNATLLYEWFDAATNQKIGDGATLNYLFQVAATDAALTKDVYALVRTQLPNQSARCPVRSATVRLSALPGQPQRIFGYDPGATVYSPSLPEKLRVIMDPPASAVPSTQHTYRYQWFRDNGTVEGEELTWNTTDTLLVTTDDIDIFWVRITGTHEIEIGGVKKTYEEVTVSEHLYVDLYGTCMLPPLTVRQSTINVQPGDTLTFTAECDWPGVEYEWYRGRTGDTRNRVTADPNTPNQLIPNTNTIDPYWVRARLACGAVQDGPTLTFTKGGCGPVLINPDIPSVEVAYGASTVLAVDAPAMTSPIYTWFRNLGLTNPEVTANNGAATLPLTNITASGRYWISVWNDDCGTRADSFIATVRVASHPSITPPAWQTEVWTNRGTPALLGGAADGAIGYQWFRGEVGDDHDPISGAVLESYSTPDIHADSHFWVRVYASDGGIVDSPTITVKVCDRPKIGSTSPHDVYLSPGQARYIDVAATGTGLKYQWYQGGTFGDTTTGTKVGRGVDRLLIRPTETTIYWLAVTGQCGTGDDAFDTKYAGPFTASICPIIEGVSALKSSVMPRDRTEVTVTAEGTGLTYQWYIGTPGDKTNDIDGATSATLLTPEITAPISFWCEVTSGSCSKMSNAVVVGLCSEPTIRWQHGDKSISKDDTVGFFVAAEHSTEQPWITFYAGPAGDVANSTVVRGPTHYNFTMPVAQTTTYWARAVVDNCHADTGNITVTVCIPRITTPPWPVGITSGQTTTLSVATDIAAAGHQWYIGESGDIANPIDGATGPSVSVAPTADTKYWVRVKGCGTSEVDSAAALVSVCTPAGIDSHSPSGWITLGATRELWVSPKGTNVTYQWYRGVKGDTTSPIGSGFSVFVAPANTTSYWASITNGCGSAETATIVVSVCATPSITTQPLSHKVFSGKQATLSVTATQATNTPMTYQWYSGTGTTNPIAGATAPTYVTPALTAAATYWVRITAGTCSVDSTAATVSMCSYPEVIQSPDDGDIALGATVRLSTNLSPVPQAARWYRGAQGNTANPISNYSYADVTPTVTTQYWAEYTHDNCTARTRTVTVYVSIPTITTQPANVQVNNGQTATLTVAADTAGATYQWYSGTSGSGTLISGATAASYTTPAMTVTKSYWVRVTGSRGHTVDSNTATVTVCAPAVLTQQPAAASIRRGSGASLHSQATGTNLRYQWYRAASPNEVNGIAGATSSSVTVTPTDSENYWVKVTSDCGTANSVTARVSVCVDPTISVNPAGKTIYSGTSTTLSVTAASGTSEPLTYQWYSGTSGSGTPISGATGSSYTTPVLTANANYWVKVSSGICSSPSTTATVSMCSYGPTVNAPDDRDIAVGDTVRLSVNLSPVPTSGRWYRGVQGDTSTPISNYTFADVAPAVTTDYWGELTKDCTTKTRTVRVWVSIPTITTQPAATTQVDPNTTATLSVAANTAGITYQWYSGTSGGGTPISGATAASYTTPALAGGSTANYWVKVTGSRGHAVHSNTATVNWCLPASITRQPAAASIRRGSSVTLSTDATGTNLRYQWYHAASPNQVNGPSNATGTSYPVTPTDSTNYWVKVTSDCGVAYSNTARIDVCVDPTINAQPASQTIPTGGTATLSVTATSGTSMPLTYQWYSATAPNGTPISGATNATYTTPALSAAANYWVKVTSGICSTNSATAAVSLCPYPATLNSPSDRNSAAGQPVLLTISGLNPTPQTYRWYRGAQGDRSTPLSSQPSFNVYPTVTTQYWGEFTYNGCTTMSRTMTVNVCIPTVNAWPDPQTVWYGESATLTVYANNATSYQWYRADNSPIAGATSATLDTGALYESTQFWVSVNGACGRVDSDYIPVTVQW